MLPSTNTPHNQVNKPILLTVTIITSFFNPFMGAAVNIALPKISQDFQMNAIQMSWVAMSFLLSSAIFLVPFGKLADIFGRKKFFLWGAILYSVASLLCGISVSSSMLIAFRFLQGIGSALILSSSMAIITSVYPPKERGKIIGLNVSAVYVGLSAAPILGGFITQTVGWRSLFFINVAAGVFVVTAIIIWIKDEWKSASHEKFDLAGAVMYMIAISVLMYGFSRLPKIYAIAMTISGLAGMVLFVYFELKAKTPVLDMRLFSHNREFAFSNLAALINYSATFGVTFILSLYLQYIKGLTPSAAGSILVAQPLVMAVVSSISGRLSDKIDTRILSSIGMSIVVLGLFMLVFLDNSTTNTYLIACLLVLGLGFGIFSSPNTNAIMSSVEKHHLGIASATLGTMRLSGQMFSMAISTMVIHVFMGDNKFATKYNPQLMSSMHTILIIFTALCFIGVFASLARGKNDKKLSH